MKKITVNEFQGYHIKHPVTTKGIFVHEHESSADSDTKPWKYIRIIETYTKTSKTDQTRILWKRRKVTKYDVETRGGRVTNHANVSPEMIPDLIQCLREAYKDATGKTDLEAEVDIKQVDEKDDIQKAMDKLGGLS